MSEKPDNNEREITDEYLDWMMQQAADYDDDGEPIYDDEPEFETWEWCPMCNGTGQDRYDLLECEFCDGEGYVRN